MRPGCSDQVINEYFGAKMLQLPSGVCKHTDSRKGEIVGAVIAKDITERQVERMKDEFISVVSHELRTLTSIHGALGMLAGLLNAEPETGKRLLEICSIALMRL